ncbi:MAG TPA: hypothetical protein V6C65_02985 [Allocoleopsis sp.]
MQQFDPTVLIALDPPASAFCQAIGDRIEQTLPTLNLLVQTRCLTPQTSQIRLVENSDLGAPTAFNLQDTNNPALTVPALKELFRRSASTLQGELTSLLQLGRSQSAIQAARQQGLEAGSRQRVYLLMSSGSETARGVLAETVRLLRFLFQRTFKADVQCLEAIVLLPGLFKDVQTENYAATYALLKEIEVLQSDRNNLAFEGIWLLTRRLKRMHFTVQHKRSRDA